MFWKTKKIITRIVLQVASYLTSLQRYIEDPIRIYGLYFLDLVLEQKENLKKFWQEQESASKEYLKAEQADFADFVREKKETFEDESRDLTAQHKELVEDVKNKRRLMKLNRKALQINIGNWLRPIKSKKRLIHPIAKPYSST